MAPPIQSTFAGFEYLGKATRFAQEILEVIDHVSLFEEFSNQEFEALCDFMVCYTAPRHGVLISGGPLDRLTARAVFVVGPDDKIKYVEYVKEITEQPNYEAVLAALK